MVLSAKYEAEIRKFSERKPSTEFEEPCVAKHQDNERDSLDVDLSSTRSMASAIRSTNIVAGLSGDYLDNDLD